MSKYTVSEYDGYALIVKDGRDMNSEEVADELNYLDKERANRDKTLSDIAQALGLEKGDVDGIGAAIEGLTRDANRERIKLDGVQEFREYMLEQHKRFGKDIATVMMDSILLGYLAERGIKLGMQEALAAGEAG